MYVCVRVCGEALGYRLAYNKVTDNNARYDKLRYEPKLVPARYATDASRSRVQRIT